MAKSDHLITGVRKAALVAQAQELRALGKTWGVVASKLGIPESTLHRWEREGRGAESAADLAPKHHRSGRPCTYQPTDADCEVIRRLALRTNEGEGQVNLQFATRTALERQELSTAFATQLRERIRQGKDPLPPSWVKKLAIPEAVVRQARSPRDASLRYHCAPGSAMWQKGEDGEDVFIQPGDLMELDDATINFAACVPWPMGGCKVSDRWGVKLGRFQWLVGVDVGSRYVPGFSYTARPRESYRAEDIQSLLSTLFAQHGVWRKLRLEQGVWKSNQIHQTLDLMGVGYDHTYSPRQKPFIEGLFDAMWTRLSLMPGQVGRFQGEEEEAKKIYVSCRSGARDPREFFPMLPEVFEAFRQAIHDHNTHLIRSAKYGQWIPAERWEAAMQRNPLRQLPAQDLWMFSPHARTVTVKGAIAATSVRLMEDYSVQYAFSEDWLAEYDRCKVTLHFDPLAPDCSAGVVLAADIRNRKAGDYLGQAAMVDRTVRAVRRAFCYGLDEDLGPAKRSAVRAGLHRTVQAIDPQGRVARSVTEVQDGRGGAIRHDSSPSKQAASPQRSSMPAPEAPQRRAKPVEVVIPWSKRRLMEEEDEYANL